MKPSNIQMLILCLLIRGLFASKNLPQVFSSTFHWSLREVNWATYSPLHFPYFIKIIFFTSVNLCPTIPAFASPTPSATMR
jgi:hypothetical protein